MRFSTLLTLIRSGQVSQRSVIRGPTSHQLWRFASRVKGISREFGLCYSCGASVERTALACPYCSRSQELPGNPDVLLETEAAAAKPVYVEAKSPPQHDDAATEFPMSQMEAAEAPSPSVEAPSPVRPAKPPDIFKPAAVESRAPAAPPEEPLPSALPGERGIDLSIPEQPAGVSAGSGSRLRRPPAAPKDRVLSAREFALAFSLEYDPQAEKSAAQRKFMRQSLTAVLAASFLFVGWLLYYIQPTIYSSAWDWGRGLMVQAFSGNRPHAANSQPAGGQMPGVPDHANWPVAQGVATPSQTTNPAKTGVAAPPSLSVAAPEPLSMDAPVSPQEMDTLAMTWRASGLDAEARHDYAAAVIWYERIEKLPRDHWPADTENLLAAAKQRDSHLGR
jgi:hypothetical protein